MASRLLEMFALRPSRLCYVLLGLGLFATTITMLFDEGTAPHGDRRRLAFLDGSSSTHSGVYMSSPQFTALVQPSAIDGSVHRDMPTYDPAAEVDFSCDDVLLYMPAPLAHGGHGNQLNGYLLAAMIATYANKAMVVLEEPRERSEFQSGSQFGCPEDAIKRSSRGKKRRRGKKKIGFDERFPAGLSRLVRHSDWLSRKCPVPCQGMYSYDDWETIRKKRKNSIYYPKLYTPQEVMCKNDDGRRSNVLVVGGDEARDYFDGHFRDRMLKRPSLASYGWAARLGARGSETKAFSALSDEGEIWDYVAGLISRSAVLRFQPWIARDAEVLVRRSGLPLDAPYDAVHVRRGDKLDESRAVAEEYWTSLGYRYPDPGTILHPKEKAAPSAYIPFDHYLTQYDGIECSSEARLVYVATDDPHEVRREISELPQDEHGNTLVNDGCHRLKFFFSPAEGMGDLHLDAGPPNGDCEMKYARNIAGVADLLISAKSDLFIGEFNSNWGRLVRIFRMRWRGDAPGDGTVVEAKEMRVAWGDRQPLPPGM